jgi:hypothetical protein
LLVAIFQREATKDLTGDPGHVSFSTAAGMVLNHYLWISYFRDAYEYRVPQIMAFFVPCVWLVPFLYFVSVSLGDNVLPSATHSGGLGAGGLPGGMGGMGGMGGEGGGGKSSALKSILAWAGRQRDVIMGASGEVFSLFL